MGNDVSRDSGAALIGQEGQFHTVADTAADDSSRTPGSDQHPASAAATTETVIKDREADDDTDKTAVSDPDDREQLSDGAYAVIADCRKRSDDHTAVVNTEKTPATGPVTPGTSPGASNTHPIVATVESTVSTDCAPTVGSDRESQDGNAESTVSVSQASTLQRREIRTEPVASVPNTSTLEQGEVSTEPVEVVPQASAPEPSDTQTETNPGHGHHKGGNKGGILKMFKFSKRNKDKVAAGVKAGASAIGEQISASKDTAKAGSSSADHANSGSGSTGGHAKLFGVVQADQVAAVAKEVVAAVKSKHEEEDKCETVDTNKNSGEKNIQNSDQKTEAVSTEVKPTSEVESVTIESPPLPQVATDPLPKSVDSDVSTDTERQQAEEPNHDSTEVKAPEQSKVKKKSWSFQFGGKKAAVEMSPSGEATVCMDPSVSSDSQKQAKPKRNKFSFKRFTSSSSSGADFQETSSGEHVEQKPTKLKKIKAKKEKKGKSKKGQAESQTDTDARSDSFCYVPSADDQSTPKSRKSIVDDDAINLDHSDAFEGVSLSSLSQDEDVSISPRLSKAPTKSVGDVMPGVSPAPTDGVVAAATDGVVAAATGTGLVAEAADCVYSVVHKGRAPGTEPEHPGGTSSTKDSARGELVGKVEEKLRAEAATLSSMATVGHLGNGKLSPSSDVKGEGSFVEKLSTKTTLPSRTADSLEATVMKYGNIQKRSGKSKEKIVAEFDGLKNGLVLPTNNVSVDDDSDAYVQLEELVEELKDKPTTPDRVPTRPPANPSVVREPSLSESSVVNNSTTVVSVHRDGDFSTGVGNVSAISPCSGVCSKRVLVLKDIGVQAPDVLTPSDVNENFNSSRKREFVDVGVQFPESAGTVRTQVKIATDSKTGVNVPAAYF